MPPGSALGLALSDKVQDGDDPQIHSNENFWKTKVAEMKRAGVPWNVFVHDNAWRGGKDHLWQWDLQKYPDPAEFEAFSVQNGMVNMLDFNRRDAQLTPLFAQLLPRTVPNGGMIAGARGPENFEDFPDFTDPGVRDAFFGVMATNTFSKGFAGDFLWLDEFDFPINPQGLQANGRTWTENANAYFYFLEKAVGDGWDKFFQGKKRPYVISRGSSAGAQRFGYMWSGDLQSTQGEMQLQIRGMQAAGLSGFPFWTHDAGGFFGDPALGPLKAGDRRHPNPVLYRNWAAAMGSFSPFWKPHGLGLRFPLDNLDIPGLPGFDTDEVAAMKRYAQLRMRLYPYNYTIARQAHDQGLPMARAMLIDHQNEDLAWKADQQYMWGDQFLIAPVTDDGRNPTRQTQVAVWFPQGVWWDFNAPEAGPFQSNGQGLSGMSASTGILPTFVKAGSMIPEYQPANTIRDLDRQTLVLEVFPGADGGTQVVEDDETSEDFLKGANRAVPIQYQDRTSTIMIGDARGAQFTGAVTQRRYVIELHGQTAFRSFRAVQGGQTETLAQVATREQALAQGGAFFESTKRTLTLVTSRKAVVTLAPGAAASRPVLIEPVR